MALNWRSSFRHTSIVLLRVKKSQCGLPKYVLFFRCSAGEENQVMFLLNEKMVFPESCNEKTESGLCSWNDFKEKYGNLQCDLEWCKNTTMS